MYECIIFDCDGVLVDSEIIFAKIDAEILQTMGHKMGVEECLKLFTGRSVSSIHSILEEKIGEKLENFLFKDVKQHILDTLSHELKPLIKGSVECYGKKVKLGIASSSNRHWIHRVLEATDQLHLFDKNKIFSFEDVQHHKPSPDVFLHAASQMGVEPARCLVVEDSAMGIEAALAANMAVIGFVGGSHAQYDWYQQSLKQFGVPLIYSEFQLMEWLERRIA